MLGGESGPGPKLELRDVVVRYGTGGSTLTAVDGATVTVPKGGTLGLVGESGCGKSTIAKAIVGLVPIAGGRVTLDGVDCTAQSARSRRDFRQRVQMIFQDPYSSLNPRMTVGATIMEAQLTRGGRSRDARQAQTLRILDMVGLPAMALDRFPHQFSGGQRQRVALGRALAVEPEVIIHDEVTSSLDVSVQATILNLLKQLQRDLGLSYLLISHDLSTVRYMSDQVAVMYLGRVVEAASTEALFDAPTHPYTAALIASIPKLGGTRRAAPLTSDLPDPRRPPAGCRFHTRCPVGPLADPGRVICVERDPQAVIDQRRHRAACHFAPEVGSPEGTGHRAT